jgi:hypothetical protein
MEWPRRGRSRSIVEHVRTVSGNPIYGDEKEIKGSTSTAQPARRLLGRPVVHSLSLCAHMCLPWITGVLEPTRPDDAELNICFTNPSSMLSSVSARGAKSGQDRILGS